MLTWWATGFLAKLQKPNSLVGLGSEVSAGGSCPFLWAPCSVILICKGGAGGGEANLGKGRGRTLSGRDPRNSLKVSLSQPARTAGIIRKSGKRKACLLSCGYSRDLHWACGDTLPSEIARHPLMPHQLLWMPAKWHPARTWCKQSVGGNVIKRTKGHTGTARREVKDLPWLDSGAPWQRMPGSGLWSAVWPYGLGHHPSRGLLSTARRKGQGCPEEFLCFLIWIWIFYLLRVDIHKIQNSQ